MAPRFDLDARVEAKAGTALCFQPAVMHEGRPVERGEKLILRSDVFYRP